jgi:hypothetical protein
LKYCRQDGSADVNQKEYNVCNIVLEEKLSRIRLPGKPQGIEQQPSDKIIRRLFQRMNNNPVQSL